MMLSCLAQTSAQKVGQTREGNASQATGDRELGCFPGPRPLTSTDCHAPVNERSQGGPWKHLRDGDGQDRCPRHARIFPAALIFSVGNQPIKRGGVPLKGCDLLPGHRSQPTACVGTAPNTSAKETP